MASTFTTNLNLEKPGIGEQDGDWGATLNSNFDGLDTAIASKVSASGTATLTNKTIDADNNTISNLEVDNLKSGVLDTDISSVSGSDDTLASAKSIKTYVDAQVATKDTLAELSDTSISSPAAGHLLIYDNTQSHFENATLTAGSNVSITNADGQITIAATDTNTQLSQEQVEDFVGGMLDGTETFIDVSYDDTDGNIDFVVPVKDEDDFASNSDTHLATQQSIKAYVDANAGGSVALDDIGVGDAESTLATSAGNIIIDAQGSDTDIVFKGTDGTSDITGIKIDMSETAQIQLPNDSQQIAFGNDQDVTVTHNHNVGLTLNSKDLSGVASVNTTSTGTRNYILNSSFDVAQRGQTINATTPISGANNSESYCLDQWIIVSDGNDIIDVAQSTTAPTGSTHSISLSIETANKKAGVLQWLEASQCQNLIGKTVTLSFQAKSDDAAIDDFRAVVLSWDGTADQPDKTIISSFGSEGSNPTYNTNVTAENTSANLNLSTSFQKFSITCDIDTSGAKNVGVYIFSNTTTGLSTGENIFISQVQLEVGSTATEYVHEDYSMTWLKCARYFRGWVETSDDSASEGPIANGHNMSGSGARIHLNNPVPFRATPTIDQSSTFVVSNGTGDITGFTSIDTVGNGQNGLYFVVTYSSSIPNGGQVIIFLKEGQGGIARWFVSCELGV